ncbi:zinc alcohol dehydrogenase [Cladophialophora carrionii]|uniref:Zinc alcohol dehydrogenase n=1 Tax=Cladophialophora carrionii TaxID=86049 RepID=A0A1C1CYD4_9EURO|nr:zinc alcohol dehydrogenase [Cladophialophora carrionii]
MATATAAPLPSTMRAWQFTTTHGGLEKNLTLNTAAPLPPHDAHSLGKNKLLVQVLAMSLNPVDYKIAELPLVGRFAIKTPASPGLDFAGRVVAVGEGLQRDSSSSKIAVGALVFGRLDGPTQFGTLAEYTVASRAGVALLPQGVSPRDAACVGTAALTAYQCVVPNIPRVKRQDGSGDTTRVFINGGSGGTGTWGIQIAKAMGCYVATSCSAGNADLCRSLGADEVVDYAATDVVEALTQSAATSGNFDLVVDNVGGDGRLFWQCHRFTNPKATYVQIGAPIGLHTALDMAMKYSWPGFLGGGRRKFKFLGVGNDSGQLEEIGKWMADGKVRPVVADVLPMQDAPKGFEKIKTERTKGKIVVVVSEG